MIDVQGEDVLIALLTVLIVLGLVGGLSFAGLWLCWHGLCGSVVDQHPHCAKCRYDLYGHVASPELCPECGSNLWLLDAVTVGHRKRGFDRVGAGVLCLALSALPIAWMMHENEASSHAGHGVAAQAANQQQAAVRQHTLAQRRTVYRSAAELDDFAANRNTSRQEHTKDGTQRRRDEVSGDTRPLGLSIPQSLSPSVPRPLDDVLPHADCLLPPSRLLMLLDEENTRAAQAMFVVETDISSEFMPRYKKEEGSDFLPDLPQPKWLEADSKTARDGKALRFRDSGWKGTTGFANDAFRSSKVPMIADPTRDTESRALSFALRISHASATRSSARLTRPSQSASGSSFTQPPAVRAHSINTRLRSERLPSHRISPGR